jgi:hypothetical protein
MTKPSNGNQSQDCGTGCSPLGGLTAEIDGHPSNHPGGGYDLSGSIHHASLLCVDFDSHVNSYNSLDLTVSVLDCPVLDVHVFQTAFEACADVNVV